MLVKLLTPSDVTPQVINFDPAFPSPGADATLVGYGATSEGGASSFILQEASIPTIAFTACDSYWNKLVDSDQICAGMS
jgi:Trypsin